MLFDLIWDFYYSLFADPNGILENIQFTFFSIEYYDMATYLTLISSIITMIIILLIIGHFIKKAFNVFGRII